MEVTQTVNGTNVVSMSESVQMFPMSSLSVVSVYSWTSWSPWFPRCGSDHRNRSRSCEVPSSDGPFCSTCGYQNVTAKQNRTGIPCCESECIEKFTFKPL